MFTRPQDWTRVSAWLTAKEIALRVVNRLFVGLPLCVFNADLNILPTAEEFLGRDADYNAINDYYSDALVKTALIVGLTSDLLKPCVFSLKNHLLASFFSRMVAKALYSYIPRTVKRAMKHIGPLVEKRLEKEKQLGKDWPGKPVGLDRDLV